MSVDVNTIEHSFPTVPGLANMPLASKEQMLEDNLFVEYSKEELKEIFNEYRYYLNNGVVPKGSRLDEKLAVLRAMMPFSWTVLHLQLLNIFTVRFIMEADE